MGKEKSGVKPDSEFIKKRLGNLVGVNKKEIPENNVKINISKESAKGKTIGVVELSGKVADYHEYEMLEKGLDSPELADCDGAVFVFGANSRLDSVGIGKLIAAKAKFAENKKGFVLAQAPEAMKKVMNRMGLESVFGDFYETIEAAKNALSGGSL